MEAKLKCSGGNRDGENTQQRGGDYRELGPGGVIMFIHVKFAAFLTKDKGNWEKNKNHFIQLQYRGKYNETGNNG